MNHKQSDYAKIVSVGIGGCKPFKITCQQTGNHSPHTCFMTNVIEFLSVIKIICLFKNIILESKISDFSRESCDYSINQNLALNFWLLL